MLRSTYFRRRPASDSDRVCELFSLFGMRADCLLDLPNRHLSARAIPQGKSRIRYYNERRRLVGTAARTPRCVVLRDSNGVLIMRVPLRWEYAED